MKINSSREVATAFNDIKRVADFPKKIEVQHNGSWVELEQVGTGMAGGKPQLAYMSNDTEFINVSYEQNGLEISVTGATFKDANTISTSNAISARTSV